MTATIRHADFVDSIAAALQYISFYHPADYIAHLARAYELEQGPAAKDAIAQILTNSKMCAEGRRPICQDTGHRHRVPEGRHGRALRVLVDALDRQQQGLATGWERRRIERCQIVKRQRHGSPIPVARVKDLSRTSGSSGSKIGLVEASSQDTPPQTLERAARSHAELPGGRGTMSVLLTTT